MASARRERALYTEEEPQAAENGGLAAALRKLTDKMTTMGNCMGDMEKRFHERTAEAAVSEHSESEDKLSARPGTSHEARAVPSTKELRRDYEVGRELNRRLAELEAEDDFAGNSRPTAMRTRGKRSGVARTVQDRVKRDIDWPHFHIYTAP